MIDQPVRDCRRLGESRGLIPEVDLRQQAGPQKGASTDGEESLSVRVTDALVWFEPPTIPSGPLGPSGGQAFRSVVLPGCSSSKRQAGGLV